MIVMHGEIQVRVTKSNNSYGWWFADLKRGSVINVYNCFGQRQMDYLTYLVKTGSALIYHLSVEDIEEEAKRSLRISDAIIMAKMRI